MPQIYIHVGLHKTGSTVLQKNIFPYLEGDLEYLGRPYQGEIHFLEHICWGRTKRVLISSETFPGRLVDSYRPNCSYLENQLAGFERLASSLPSARVIIGVRPHAPWIESIYKHYLKYGGTLDLPTFFSFNQQALMKPDEFLIAPRLELLKRLFPDRILVYDSSKLAEDGRGIAQIIADFTETKFSGPVGLTRENVGVNSRQAQALRYLNRLSMLASKNLTGQELRRFSLVKRILRTKAAPIKLNPEVAERVVQHYADDWSSVAEHLT